MNRKVLFQVTLPAFVIGAILLGACLVSGWYIDRLQTNLTNVLSQDVTSLEAAQELEIRVRQMRFHTFLYLIDPKPERLDPIEQDHLSFEKALAHARESSGSPEETKIVQAIEDGYQRYHAELAQLRRELAKWGPQTNFGKLTDSHPVRHVVEPCQELLRMNKESMEETAQESARVTGQAHRTMLLLGILGPVGGLIIGYGVARALSRSIYRLSVRVQDVARHLDQKVASVSLVHDGDFQGLDRQLQDIVRRVEEVAVRLQQQQREMLRAEQLSAVGQLAAGVAHEVRNPLTSIKMLVEAALRPSNAKALTAEDLKVIYREIARLEQRVQAFLDFARLPTPKRALCDIRGPITQAVELIRARARAQAVEISVQLPERPPLGFLDAEQMRTVFINLFLNALDAMPQGGRLELRMSAEATGNTRLEITDTGSGIAPEIAERLFTPFTSTKPTGTGLGLSISRRIVEEHGGVITARNGPQDGACFAIDLPASRETAPTAKDKFLSPA